jgi:transketolase N-terminal domain/subunit
MTLSQDFPLLFQIQSPADLRNLSRTDIAAVAEELRRYLILTVSRMGGHFAAGLGTVELTVALHYVFDTPHDRLVWDVGHQAYPHKVLTGRRDLLRTIKQHRGLAPFPTRSESEFDTFGVGHSSTSISAALGMAIAAAARGERRRAVAVIGDGAMTAGMAFEALNHAGSLDVDLLVVLNDNDMSISNNVGAMSNYFAKVLSGRLYASLREGGKKVLRQMPTVWELARRSEAHMKGMILPGTVFEEMGLNYIGPIDGHDLHALVKTLENMRDLKGPQLLHVVTRKGKGYAPAEKDPIKWHGPGPFDPASATIFKEKSSGPTYSQIFGQWLCDMAAKDPRIMAVTPAMREGSGLVEFEKKFPDRYFDVGIAEQHAVTFAAGMACEGALQAPDHAAQEHLVEAQLALRRHLLEQRRADLHDRDRPGRLDGRGALGAAHVAGLAEAVAALQIAERLAEALDADPALHDDVEAVVHLAFLDDLLGVGVVLPAAGAQHLPDLAVRELVEELQLAQQAELLLLIDAVVLRAQLLVHARQFRGEIQARLVALLRILLQRHGRHVLEFLGISGRSVWMGGGVANTI